MKIALTKVSSKGQIVIPSELREGIKEGEQLLIIKNGNHLIIKKANDLDRQLKEDMDFAKRTEKAWKEHERGKFRSVEFDDLIKEMEKW